MAEKNWRDDVRKWMTSTASSVDDFIDARRESMKSRFGWDGVPKIQPYIGYGNGKRVWLHGRVLTNPPADLPGEDDNWWENIANTYRRFASDEVPHCDVEIRLGDIVHRVTTDAEGYFFVEEEHEFADTSLGLWTTASLRIVNHPRVTAEESMTTCKIMTPPASARFGVISDVDDTILQTGATRLLTMAKMTFLKNARTRLPLAGVAALYQQLQATESVSSAKPTDPKPSLEINPIFYVSSSPWNLFDLLEDFLELNGIPLGPLLLRDLGFDDNKFLKEGHDHKLSKARRIMRAYPDLPFLLFGDSGQEDARLYAEATEEFGDRIQAIFIRDVDPSESSVRDEVVREAIARAAAHNVPMHLIHDSAEAAQIAIDAGLLNPASLSVISDATKS